MVSDRSWASSHRRAYAFLSNGNSTIHKPGITKPFRVISSSSNADEPKSPSVVIKKCCIYNTVIIAAIINASLNVEMVVLSFGPK